VLTTGAFVAEGADPEWEGYVARLAACEISAIGFGRGSRTRPSRADWQTPPGAMPSSC
jgi:hypothetical protein